MVKNKIILLLLFIQSALWISCDSTAVFDEYQSTGGEWLKDDVKSFNYHSKDSVGYYNMHINLRADQNYPYSNIFLIVKTFQPDGKALVDTLQFEMAKPSGEILGKGLTDVKESTLWFKSKYRFKHLGAYKFDIEHAIRKSTSEHGDASLPGIRDVGLRIEKAQ